MCWQVVLNPRTAEYKHGTAQRAVVPLPTGPLPLAPVLPFVPIEIDFLHCQTNLILAKRNLWRNRTEAVMLFKSYLRQELEATQVRPELGNELYCDLYRQFGPLVSGA
jgi:hypothetical protein